MFNGTDSTFAKRAKESENGGFIVAGENYGQEFEIKAYATLSDRQKEVLLAGGQLNFINELL